VVYRPSQVPNLGISLDYYNIRVAGAISSLTSAQILDQCFKGQTSVCQYIIRDAAQNITQINLVPQNIALLATSGWDLEINYRREIFGGTLTARALGTYLAAFNQTDLPGLTRKLAGAVGEAAGGIPKLKGIVSATYDQGPYSVTTQVRMVGRAKLDNSWGPLDVDNNNVPAVAYLDLRGSYRLDFHNAELNVAVDNLLDTDPPRVASVPATPFYVITAPGTRTDLYDAIGRTYRVGLRMKF
jgi:outer membrane receptor protein involved in Fe transport